MAENPPYLGFYFDILKALLRRKVVNRSMTVLVVCGGETDRHVFQELGFSNVTISNLDSRMSGNEFAPYQWSCQDAESLTFGDNSFDMVVACAGLHHCHSPHRALLEMYRVARRCAVALEARDGFLSRIAVHLGVVDEYELTAVVGNDYAFGGVKNTSVPNYIYRWTEREITKTIASYAPYAKPQTFWFHAFEPFIANLKGRKTLKGLLVMYAACPVVWLITKIFKRQCNLFGFAVIKPESPRDLFPWLKLDNDKATINREWVEKNFKRSDGSMDGQKSTMNLLIGAEFVTSTQ